MRVAAMGPLFVFPGMAVGGVLAGGIIGWSFFIPHDTVGKKIAGGVAAGVLGAVGLAMGIVMGVAKGARMFIHSVIKGGLKGVESLLSPDGDKRAAAGLEGFPVGGAGV